MFFYNSNGSHSVTLCLQINTEYVKQKPIGEFNKCSIINNAAKFFNPEFDRSEIFHRFKITETFQQTIYFQLFNLRALLTLKSSGQKREYCR